MSEYTGSTCICCGKRFTDDDDIVVCPDCGTPYHRSCYLEKGKCINAALHDKGIGWLPDAPDETPVFPASAKKRCIRCGAENDPSLRYCEQCGTPLVNMETPRPFNEPGNGQDQQVRQNYAPGMNGPVGGTGVTPVMLNQDSDIDGVKLGDLARYIGTNPIGFLPSFIKFGKTGKKISMNIFAFLFTPVYFMYRKMKGWGIAAVIIMALLSVPDMITMLASGEYDIKIDLGIDTKSRNFVLLTQVVLYMTMVLKLLAGFFANYLYYKQAKRDILRIHENSEGKSDDDVNREIILTGGTSLGYVLLGFLIYTIVSFGVVVLLGKII